MVQRHAIEIALDLTRMPALARTSVESPMPPHIIEVMRVAAASPKACQDAAAATGEPVPFLIEAARFYLRQSLLRPDADSYRILGLRPGASRATARSHMRWLLQWLHPDRNGDLDAVYAERVVKAWREVSAASGTPSLERVRIGARKTNGASSSFRLPWIKQSPVHRAAGLRKISRAPALWVWPTGLVIVVLIVWSAVYYFGPDQTAAMINVR